MATTPEATQQLQGKQHSSVTEEAAWLVAEIRSTPAGTATETTIQKLNV